MRLAPSPVPGIRRRHAGSWDLNLVFDAACDGNIAQQIKSGW
jgi:hypothetical protein